MLRRHPVTVKAETQEARCEVSCLEMSKDQSSGPPLLDGFPSTTLLPWLCPLPAEGLQIDHLLFLLPQKRKGHPQLDSLTRLSEGILSLLKRKFIK